MLKPVINYLRCKVIRTSAYLDDIFICSPSASLLKSKLNFTLNLLVSLGFTPNYSKSHLIPTHEIIHPGYSWDSVRMSISLPKDKIVKTKKLASSILTHDPTLRENSKLLDVLVSHATGLPFAPLYYRDLQLQFCSALKTAFSWEQSIVLKAKAIANIEWWKHCEPILPSALISELQPTITLSTDASNSGWGGALSSVPTTSGR